MDPLLLPKIQKYQDFLLAATILCILININWNSNIDSKLNEFQIYHCSASSKNHLCSLIDGCSESVYIAASVISIYILLFCIYFRMRSHCLSIQSFISLDALILSIPSLIALSFKWYFITSLIIQTAQLFDSIFFYHHGRQNMSRSLLQQIDIENIKLSEHQFYAINSTNSTLFGQIMDYNNEYPLPLYSDIVAAFIRNLWSFLIWNGLNGQLFQCWLTKYLPNKVSKSLQSVHQKIIHRQLLCHFDYIESITLLCIEFIGDDPPRIVMNTKHAIIKTCQCKIWPNALRYTNVIIAVLCAYRLSYCQSISYLMYPLFSIIAAIVFIFTVIMGGYHQSVGRSYAVLHSHILFDLGPIICAIFLGYFVWKLLKKQRPLIVNQAYNSNRQRV